MAGPVEKASTPKSSVNSGVKGPEYKSQIKGDVPEKDVKAIDKANTPNRKAPGSVRV